MKRIIILFAILCLVFTACSQETGTGNTEEETYYKTEDNETGKTLGSFESSDLDGNKVTDAIFADKDVTILNIWGTYCGPCIEEMPDLSKLADELPDNAQVIGIVIDVTEGDEDMIAEARGICDSFTNIQMNDSVEKMLTDVEAIPTTFILDSSGKMVCNPFIGADVEGYRKAVMDYLDQIKPR